MKTKNIIMASILLMAAIVIGSLVATYFSYNNREITLRQQAEAQRGKIEGVHDKMWKIILREELSAAYLRSLSERQWYDDEVD